MTYCDADFVGYGPNKVDSGVEFAKLMVATAAIGKDLSTVQALVNAGTVWGEQLFASLNGNDGVSKLDDSIAFASS